MPHRFEALCSPILATALSFFAGLAAILTGDRSLLFICLIGACGGALVSLIFSPPKDPCPQRLAIKFLGSGITSALFSPWLILKMEKEPSEEFVLFVSAAIALGAIYVIRGVQRWVEQRARKFGVGDDEEEKEKRDV